MYDWAILVVAAFGAGVLNAVAGGGSFLTFPALVYFGIPPVAANATSAVAVFPGYLGAVVGFKQDILTFDRPRLMRYILVSIGGGLLGSLLLLVTSNEVFSLIVPWLLLFATAWFAIGPQISSWVHGRGADWHIPEIPVLFAISIYGGYFNGGLGIILLAAFIAFGLENLNLMNGLKTGLSLVLSAVSVVTFALAGIVHWPQAIVMMVVATIGGYAGAKIAKILPGLAIRVVVILVGTIMTLVFFQQN